MLSKRPARTATRRTGDHGMPWQIGRRLQHASLGQIIRRRNQHARPSGYSPCNSGGVGQRSEAQRHIHALRYQVLTFIVDHEINSQEWMPIHEFGQTRNDLTDGAGGRQPKAQYPAELAGVAGQVISRFEVVQLRLDASEILGARLR